jgi:hypothetical protein
MRARVPLDVDLEDQIVYGLTPMRLAYFVLALLAGLAAWSSHAPAVLRAFACATAVVIGAVVAWGRWRGRPADSWIADLAIFVASGHRLRWKRDAALSSGADGALADRGAGPG